MRWYSTHKHFEGLNFIIEKEERMPYYTLFLYTDSSHFQYDMSDPTGNCSSHQDDYTEDTLELAQKKALKNFGVPLDSWKELEENPG